MKAFETLLRGARMVCLFSAIWAAAGAAQAGITVHIDSGTLNEVLAKIAEQEIVVPISEGNSLKVQLENLRVTALLPTTTPSEPARINTSVRLKVPDLGMALTVHPRIAFHVVRVANETTLELRFEEVLLNLPLAGTIDIARTLPPLSFPAENLFLLDGAQGSVPIMSRLSRVHMETNGIRLEFDIELPSGGETGR